MSTQEVGTPRSPVSAYWHALWVAALGIAMILWSVLSPQDGSTLGLFVASASMPLAVLLAVSGRLGVNPPLDAAVGGAVVGATVAVVGHAVVFAIAYFALAGFAEASVGVLETLRIDPTLVAVARSPWTLLLFIELVVVAPLTEEAGKALGASMFSPRDRRSAFVAGVAAGAGFAVVENTLYAASAGFFGAWEPVVLGRMFGAAVHPLASGLVVLGWWEWRQSADVRRLSARFLAGAGVHALWNGSLVVLAVTSVAYDVDGTRELGTLSLAYSAALGTAAAAAVWWMATRLSVEGSRGDVLKLTDARVVAAWTVAGASTVIPMAVLMLAYPLFVTGP